MCGLWVSELRWVGPCFAGHPARIVVKRRIGLKRGLKFPHYHYSTEVCAGQYLISGDWNDQASLAERDVQDFGVLRLLGFIPKSRRIGLTGRPGRLASAGVIKNDPITTIKSFGHALVSHCTT
jgi:hypothetical protein